MTNTRISNSLGSIAWILSLVLLSGASGLQAADHPGSPAGVAGRVIGESSPLGSAGVYVYQLADLSLRKMQTDGEGNFLFADLPAGLYKVIAHKPGFTPVVVMLTRTAASTYQFLELQLAPRPRGAGEAKSNDFWSVRARIPADVLRDIEVAEGESFQLARLSPFPIDHPEALSRFQTEMQAMTGVDQIAEAGDGQMSSGGVGIAGQLGSMQVGLRGHFRHFAAESFGTGMSPAGEASTLSLNLEGEESQVRVMSLNNRLVTRGLGPENPVAFEQYAVNWSQGVGENGRSHFAAQYTEENNFHHHGPITPLEIPEASRAWRVEGAYTTSLGDGNTLQAGLRYRERQPGLSAASRREDLPGQASVDLFSHGGMRLRPAVLLEYGLYSTLSDGSLTLAPRGGIVVQLDGDWRLEGSVMSRAYEDRPAAASFFPELFAEADLCEQGTRSCYQLHLVRKADDDNLFSLGAVHRTVGETLRLYFSDDFFDRLESLYLVPGDEIPELRLVLNRRLSPQVLTSLRSSLSMGGGGVFLAADRKAYENQVRYLVTSLDTQFQSTATGVFVALHHISQKTEPLQGTTASPQMEFDRLRLMLTQDLNILFDLAAQWAVQLNMEVSRGPVSSDDELRRRFLGGIAVKF